MIATMRDVLVLNRADFERLPDEGRWEVVEGSAILMPPHEIPHQKINDNIVALFRARLHSALAISGVTVFIPRPHGSYGIQSRVPDVIVSRHEPRHYFEAGDPPDLVIEILSTPRGNVERTEKVEDYARASIGEYWIVSPFDRAVEIYRLVNGAYAVPEIASQGLLKPRAFSGVELDIQEIWPKK
jgi:Uma2 family endonuclease